MPVIAVMALVTKIAVGFLKAIMTVMAIMAVMIIIDVMIIMAVMTIMAEIASWTYCTRLKGLVFKGCNDFGCCLFYVTFIL